MGGHTELLDQLNERFLGARDRGAICIVRGRAGTGKTHLAERFLDQLPSSTLLLRGHGLQSGVPPLFPICDALRSPGLESSVFDFVRTFIAEFAKRLPRLGMYVAPVLETRRRTRHGPSDLREALPSETVNFLALSKLLQKLVRKRPLVLFLDDIQWIDPSTIAFLGYLASRLRECKVFVLLNERINGYSNENLRRLSATVRRELGKDSCELQVAELDRAGQRELLEAELGDFEFQDTQLAWLEASSRATAFHMRELLGMLRERGTIAERGGVWRFVERVEAPLPPRSVFDYQLERLRRAEQGEPSARQLIGLAACVGTCFDARLLAAVLDQDPLQIRAALDGIAERSGLVHRNEDSTSYCFDHDIIREVMLKELGGFKRDLHLRIARAMTASEEPAALLVARQFEAACEWGEAWCWYLAAAREASNGALFESARDYAERADELLGKLGVALVDTRRVESTSELGRALHGAERYSELIELIDSRRELLELPGAGLLLWLFGRAEVRVPDERSHRRALRHFNEALRRSAGELDYARRAQIYADRVNAYDTCREYANSKRAYKRGLADARRSGDPRALVRLLRLSCIFWQPVKVVETLEQAVELARANELEYARALCKNDLGSAHFALRNLAAAREHYRESHDLLQTFGGYRRDTPLNNLGLVTLFDNELSPTTLARARDLLLEALEISVDEHSKLLIESNLGALEGKTHNFDRSVARLEPLVARADATGDLYFRNCIRHNLACALLESGQCERALGVLMAVKPHHSHPEELLVLAKRAALHVRLLECLARPVEAELREQARHLEVSTKPQAWLYRAPWYFCDIEFWED